MKALFFILMTLAPSVAFAADTLPPECRQIAEHVPSADVSYKPGVDVHGKAVAPADINASPIGQEDPLVVPITIDLAQRLNRQATRGLELETTTGFMEVWKDGHITYNGQDLTQDVKTLCRGGQQKGDDIEYAPQKEKAEF